MLEEKHINFSLYGSFIQSPDKYYVNIFLFLFLDFIFAFFFKFFYASVM